MDFLRPSSRVLCDLLKVEVIVCELARFCEFYYLVDETNKQIYIGSAIRLGDRVKIGRKEIPFWNKFRYEILHPEYHSFLREIEYHSIMNFAKFFQITEIFLV